MQTFLDYLIAHEPYVWPVLGAALTVLLRIKSPAQWIELADRSPRTHGLVVVLRAIFPDLPLALEGLAAVVGRKAAQAKIRPSLPPPPSAAALLVAAILLSSGATGCAHGNHVRTALALSAEALQAAETAYRPALHASLSHCVETAQDADAARRCASGPLAVEAADEVARAALQTAMARVQATGTSDVCAYLRPLANALGGVLSALHDAGFHSPDLVNDAAIAVEFVCP